MEAESASRKAGGAEQFDERKLRNLMLYVSQRFARRQDLGTVKLNKILFYSDFYAYLNRGRSITGAEYRHYELGPAPKGMKAMTTSLENSGDVYVSPTPMRGGMRRRVLLPISQPDIGMFTAEEIALVESVIDEFGGQTAGELSQSSHQHAGWRLTQMEETIPYFAAFLPDEPVPLTDGERAWVQETISRL